MAARAAHFCGRMFVSGRPEEHDIRDRIKSCLEEHDVAFGFGALACGADILLAESLLERAGQLHVTLPFSPEKFEAVSVSIGGSAWTARYRTCLARAVSVQVIAPQPIVNPFEVTSRLAMAAALSMDANAIQIAVFDGHEPDKPVGTSSDIAHWAALGGLTHIIDIPAKVRLMSSMG